MKEKKITTIITSPPYSDSYRGGGTTDVYKKKYGYTGEKNEGYSSRKENVGNLKHGGINVVITSPPYEGSLEGTTRHTRGGIASRDPALARSGSYATVMSFGVPVGYSPDPNNIGNLKSDEKEYEALVDTIITSPPYSESLSTTDDEERRLERTKGEHFDCGYLRSKRRETASHNMGDGYSENPKNIGNLPHGKPDESLVLDETIKRLRQHGRKTQGGPFGRSLGHPYSKDPKNIGNLEHGDVDTIITSPPYSGSVNAPNDPKRRAERMRKAGLDPKTIVGGKARCGQTDWQYGDSEEQIGSLPHGEINTVITSPPYSDSYKASSKTRKEQAERVPSKILKRHPKGGGPLSLYTSEKNVAAKGFLEGMPKSEGNIGNLRHGEINAIVTSPPYAEANRGGGIALKGYEGKHGRDENLHLRNDRPLSDDPDNISNKPYGEGVDVHVTSPPYMDSSKGDQEGKGWEKLAKDPESNRFGRKTHPSVGVEYSDNEENIGNEKGETYLQAMLKVYGEMYKVLKPGGKVIIVVKPFIRNKKVVDLPYHTWLLLQKCGFKLVEVLKFRLPQLSFWRVLYRQKHSDVERINHEYILVCQK